MVIQTEADSLGLPPALRNYADRLASVPDPKLRYQQLLFLAKDLPPMNPSLKTDENRVHGCTSVVHVFVSLDADKKVQLEGDSDSQLTKGLLALLVNGMAGCAPEAVASIDPSFISYSGLSASLTPSRNNGFVSMVAKIKQQVADLIDSMEESGVHAQTAQQNDDIEIDSSRPIYSSILRKLKSLQPNALDVEDNSAMHAGHPGVVGHFGESHFVVRVVADAFEGLSMVQRHRLVYTLLTEEMSGGLIHALQIDARTPEEVS